MFVDILNELDRTKVGDIEVPKSFEPLKHPKSADIMDFVDAVTKAVETLRKPIEPEFIMLPAYSDRYIDMLDGIDPSVETKAKDEAKIPKEMIAWSIQRDVPASLTEDMFSEAKREIRPRRRESIEKVIDERRVEKQIWGQKRDVLFQFDILCKDRESTEDLVKWFKTAMYQLKKLFLKIGVDKIFFWERSRDDNLADVKPLVHVPSLQYAVKLEDLFVEHGKLINEIRTSIENTINDEWILKIK